jgi:hypothetical protein
MEYYLMSDGTYHISEITGHYVLMLERESAVL